MRTEDTTFDDLTNPGAARDFFKRRPMPPFEPDAEGFSLANALWLMELSRIVYRRDAPETGALVPSRSGFLEKAGVRQVAPFFNDDRTDTQAMLVASEHEPRFAALVFRGTEQRPKDLVTDILFAAKKVSGEDVHGGFADAFDSVWPKIVPELDKISVPIFYAGHSLGAALATLAAFRRPPRATYAFGSPRVGKANFAMAMKGAKLFRIVDDHDIVTTVPFEAMGFLHVGVEHKISENRQLAPLLRVKKEFLDHAPVNYIDRLA